MQQLVDDPAYGALDLVALVVIELRQPGLQPAQLGGHHVGGHGAQRDHGRGDLGGPAQAEEVADLGADQLAGVLDLGALSRIELVGRPAGRG